MSARETIRCYWKYRVDAQRGRFPDLEPGVGEYLRWLDTLRVTHEGGNPQ